MFEKDKHKYDLYNRFDAIVYEEDNKPNEIAVSGAIDIDWN